MILAIEHAAAVRRAADLAAYLGKLDDARRDAVALKLDIHADHLAAMIRAAQAESVALQGTIAEYERQESAREATRALRSHARAQFEQLLLNPQAQVL